jgi:hypothetical protein
MGHSSHSLLDADEVGPVDLAVMLFDGPVSDRVGDAIADLVHTGMVRVIDLAVIDADDDSEDVDDHSDLLHGTGFAEIADQRLDLLTNEDLHVVKQALPVGKTGLVVVWENTWAGSLAEAVRSDGAQLAVLERLSHDAVTEAITQAKNPELSQE